MGRHTGVDGKTGGVDGQTGRGGSMHDMEWNGEVCHPPICHKSHSLRLKSGKKVTVQISIEEYRSRDNDIR